MDRGRSFSQNRAVNRDGAAAALANHPLLDGVPASHLSFLLSRAVARRVCARQVLCGSNERTGNVWFLTRGLLHATVQSRRGSPITVDVLQAGDTFGYLNCWMAEPHIEDVCGLVPADVVGVPAASFMDFVDAHQPAAQRLLRETAERMRALMRLRAICTEPSSSRVRSVLAFLHEKMGRNIPMTREMIATVAGLTTETVSRSMAPLHRRRVIALRRGLVEILDPGGLS